MSEEDKEFTSAFDERVYGCVSGEGDEVNAPIHLMAEIVVALDSNADNVSKSLKRLMADGHVVKVLRRYYTLGQTQGPLGIIVDDDNVVEDATPEPDAPECPLCPHPLYMHKDGRCLEDGCDCGALESQSTVTAEASEASPESVEGARSEFEEEEVAVEAPEKQRAAIELPTNDTNCPCYWFWNSSGEARYQSDKHHPECDGHGNRVASPLEKQSQLEPTHFAEEALHKFRSNPLVKREQSVISHTVRLRSSGTLDIAVIGCDLFKASPVERDLIEGIVQLVQVYEGKRAE